MFTYLIIGVIVQLIVLTERAVRFPEVYEAWYTDWRFLAGIIGGSLINALLWPFTIIYEIYLVANGL